MLVALNGMAISLEPCFSHSVFAAARVASDTESLGKMRKYGASNCFLGDAAGLGLRMLAVYAETDFHASISFQAEIAC